ncbi:MAG: hypothetical protein IPO63_07930 [Bacteroidetes bacterium]|nr:hypothetical protein [Bacteroidota bacterium]
MNTEENFLKEQMKKEFPNKEKTLEYLTILDNIKLEKITLKELEKQIKQYFPIIPYHENQIDSGKELFRTATCNSELPHKSVDRIKYPPMEVLMRKNEFGRANRPDQQVFYCAANFLISTMEVCQHLKCIPLIKERFGYATVGIWETVSPLKILYICHSPKANSIREEMRNSNEAYINILKKDGIPEVTIDANKLILEFFANQFAKDNIKSHHEFKYSVYYSSMVEKMNEISHFSQHGLVYPSVPMKYIGDNVCLTKATYEDKNNLQIKKALFIYYYNVDFDKGEFDYDILDESESIFGTQIYWRKKKYN